MNPLRDDKAPYAIALLLGAFGWHATQISKEVRESKTIVFTVSQIPDENRESILLENVTNKDFIQQLRFEISCPKMSACIDENRANFDSVGAIRVKPIFDYTPQFVDLQVSLPPGAGVNIDVFRKQNGPFPDLKYTPGKALIEDGNLHCESNDAACKVQTKDNRSLDVLVIDGRSWRGWLVNNYLEVVVVTFAAVCLLLLISFMSMLFRREPAPVVAKRRPKV